MRLTCALAAVLLLVPAAFPKTKDKPPKPPKPASVSNGSPEKADFRRLNPCPSNGKTSGSCPGYVVAYVKSPKQGGMHSVTNMQWLTTMEAKGKTKVQ
jgi:hypothetical protein